MGLGDIRIVSFAVIILAALTIVILEKVIPYTKNQKFFREGFFDDFVLYTFIQSYILGIIISFIIEFVDSQTNLTRLQLLSGWPVLLQLLFFFVTHDFFIYWLHRFQHNNPLFWRIHEAHHSNKNIDWLAGSRSHPLEILVYQTIEFAPIILLGAAPEVAVLKGTIDAVWGMYIHSNINVRSGKLQYFINGPEMHRWHHSDRDEEAYNKNFSTKLAIWDWIFGTAFFPAGKKPDFYGLSEVEFPKNYFNQVLFAFRRSKRSPESDSDIASQESDSF
jgi:sterol desaturase/sphingolipid hydroxylase (fatty acid hydroxylase superfamily)